MRSGWLWEKSVSGKSKGSVVGVSLACQETDRTLGCLGHKVRGGECYVGRVPIGYSTDFDFKCYGKPLEVFMQESDVI